MFQDLLYIFFCSFCLTFFCRTIALGISFYITKPESISIWYWGGVWLVVVFGVHNCSYLGGGGVSRVGKSSGCTRLRLWCALVSTSVILNLCIKTRFFGLYK